MTIARAIGEANRSISLDNASGDFLKLAKALAVSRADIHALHQLAQEITSRRRPEVIENRQVIKSPVSVGTRTSGRATAAYQQRSTGFFGSLSECGASARIYNAGDFCRVPLRTIISVLTTAPTAEYTSELGAKPM